MNDIQDDCCFNELNYHISEKELLKCIKELKNNKAVGLDSICNEMIKYSQHAMLNCLLKVFNKILSSGSYPKEWCRGYIVPIFKGGDRSIPSNYRGITIMNCIAKLFNTVLNKRLDDFFDKRNLINCRQIGFKKGSRTSDHMFILKSLIEKYTKRSSKLYACFIDFKKAYDKVDHICLIYKMLKAGIGGNFIKLFKDSYLKKGLEVCVKMNNMLSSPFKCKTGVRQGDPVSPNLFKLFINDLVDYIDTDVKPTLNNFHYNCLLYADDIVLLALSEEDLKKQVEGVEKFCKDWGLEVNTNKSKVMVFNTKGVEITTDVCFRGVKLENVSTYRYLGILFHISGKINFMKQDLLERGQKAMFKLMSYFKDGKPSVQTGFHLFDRVVKPVLLYGSDVFGINNLRYKSIFNEMYKDIFEKCHLKFCRYLLGVHKHAPIIGIYGETGRFPIYISEIKMFIKFWYRAEKCTEKSDILLYNAMCYNRSIQSTWFKTVKKILNLINVSTDQAILKNIHFLSKSLMKTYQDKFIEGWRRSLNCDDRNGSNMKNKLRVYRNFKSEFKCEKYLMICNNAVFRSGICQLRISCHKLRMETGRYCRNNSRLNPEDRICTYCDLNEVENECHFLLRCPAYSVEREVLFNSINKVYKGIDILDDNMKLDIILASVDKTVIWALGYYINVCFKKRLIARSD